MPQSIMIVDYFLFDSFHSEQNWKRKLKRKQKQNQQQNNRTMDNSAAKGLFLFFVAV